MTLDELEPMVGKALKLREPRGARGRVRQMERELRAEPANPREATYVPECLLRQIVHGVSRAAEALPDELEAS
jgi:hypothetical protein